MKRTSLYMLILLFTVFCIAAQADEALKLMGPSNAARVTYQSVDENKLLVSVLDAKQNPITGLTPADFSVIKGDKTGKIISVEPFESTKEIPFNIVLVIDNSFSMERRNAVRPLLDAVDQFLKIVRPIDNIHAIAFDDNETVSRSGHNLNAKTIQSNKPEELRKFAHDSYTNKLTRGTYLYEGMLLGLDIIRTMPEKSNKSLIVFSDGEDINSTVKTLDLQQAAREIPNFSMYAIDFTEKESMDSFLKSFAEAHSGKIWKASSSDKLVAAFKSVQDMLLSQYLVSFRFLNPPQGTLAMEPATVTIEEVTTIDSAPLLNYVFFEAGKSAIPAQYILFSNASETNNFSADSLTDAMDKYRNTLNIIGKRLVENPSAKITIVGCNSNQGAERGNTTLSRDRGVSVQSYLQQTWGIDPSRMEIKAQNLPDIPSSSTTPAGIAENQRVEITSDHPAILDTVRSMYVQEMVDPKALRILPNIKSEAGIDNWKVELQGEGGTVIGSESGKGSLTDAVTFNLVPAGLSKIASFKTLTANVEVKDKEGETFRNAAATNVQFIRKEQMKSEKQGYRVLEKYALILFEFNKADIKEGNKAVIDKIVARMKQVPSAKVTIVGHTDTIGQEDHNVKLSEQRAKAVYDQIIAAGVAEDRIQSTTGVGPREPLYDNANPEGRALNRTVTVTLDYEEKG